MKHWLMKTEPATFSIDDLAARGSEPWDGVRNYQARNFMRDDMRVGDKVFIYHSSCAEPGIVGIARVASNAYPDPTQFDPDSDYHDPRSTTEAPRWWLVEVAFERKLEHHVTLARLKRESALADMALLRRGNRLSVLPLKKTEWDAILSLCMN